MSLARDTGRRERGYYRRIEIAMAAAIAVHASVFALVPPYVPRPFRLHEPPLRVVGAIRETGAVNALPAVPPGAESAAPPTAETVRSEQLRFTAEHPRLSAAGEPGLPGARTGGAESGMGEGAEGAKLGDEPPVYYAFDSPPRALRRVEPDYPAAARAGGAEGTVILNANIDERGRILRVWVVRSSAPEVLVEAATDALYQFEFAPGSQQGIPVKCTVAVPFRFSLKEHL